MDSVQSGKKTYKVSAILSMGRVTPPKEINILHLESSVHLHVSVPYSCSGTVTKLYRQCSSKLRLP